LIASQPFIGECFTPEARGAIRDEHWHRPRVALAAAAKNRVLCAAAGEGCNNRQLGTVGRFFGGTDR
jgi:hypothetical protein